MDLNKMNKILFVALSIMMLSLSGCGVSVSYSLNGASIDYKSTKTVSVQYFQNRASIVQPTLSQDITDALIDKCKAQTKLKVVSSDGDVNFEGSITEYKSQPFTATSSSSQSAQNRFTISVKVKFVNTVNPDYSYEQTFSKYREYSSTEELTSVQDKLAKEIVDELIEDIFNKAFANW
jgi:hypothetical protein